MSVEVLSVNLDSLYLSIHGELNQFADSIIPAAKEQAQLDDEDLYQLPDLSGIPGGPFYVSRKGASRDYPYVLQNARFRVNMTRRGGSRPTLTVQVKSDLLYEYDLPSVETAVHRLCQYLLEDAYRITVSRADIAVDFQDPSWRFPDMQDCNTRARSRFVHYEGKHVTGMTFGRHQGSMQVQIYRKSETLVGDNKQWMREIWASSGNYDEELPVFRVEVRFYRELLRELKGPDGSLCTISDLYSSLGDLADYAVCGRKPFFRVVDELYRLTGLSQGHSERQEDAPWWSTLKHAFKRLSGSQGRKRINDELRYQYTKAVTRAAGALASAAAIARSQKWTRYTTDPALFARDVFDSFFSDDSLLWSEMVNHRTHALRGSVGPPVHA